MKNILFLIILPLILIPYVDAIGMSPAKYQINFKPGLTQTFDFKVFVDSGKTAELYVEGDFKDYVILSEEVLPSGENEFKATLTLPNVADKPGINRLRIGAREVAPQEGAIGAVTAVEGIVEIRVPYPGQYLELELETANFVLNEPLNFVVKMKNFGSSSLSNLNLFVDVMDSSSEEIGRTSSDGHSLKPDEIKEVQLTMGSFGIEPGTYNATAFVVYSNKTASDTKTFRIGDILIKILNVTSDKIEQGKIGKLEVELQSFWNDIIPNVFFEVSLFDEQGLILNTKSESVDLITWEIVKIPLFIDTTDLNIGNYKSNLTVFYADKEIIRELNIEIFEPSFDFFSTPVILGFVILILALFNLRLFLKGKKLKRR